MIHSSLLEIFYWIKYLPTFADNVELTVKLSSTKVKQLLLNMLGFSILIFMHLLCRFIIMLIYIFSSVNLC